MEAVCLSKAPERNLNWLFLLSLDLSSAFCCGEVLLFAFEGSV